MYVIGIVRTLGAGFRGHQGTNVTTFPTLVFYMELRSLSSSCHGNRVSCLQAPVFKALTVESVSALTSKAVKSEFRVIRLAYFSGFNSSMGT